MEANQTHPVVLAFGKTYEQKFPLILIVGREPNNDSVSNKMFGHYEFKTKEQRRCGFWNTAFGIIGSYNGLTCSQMKLIFENEKHSSPIMFTDAFPKGIKSIVTNKDIIRRSIIEEELAEHVNSICQNEDLISRIKLVIFSGLNDKKYDLFKQLFQQNTLLQNVPLVHVPFFYGTNTEKIRNNFSSFEIDILKQVFMEFNNQ